MAETDTLYWVVFLIVEITLSVLFGIAIAFYISIKRLSKQYLKASDKEFSSNSSTKLLYLDHNGCKEFYDQEYDVYMRKNKSDREKLHRSNLEFFKRNTEC